MDSDPAQKPGKSTMVIRGIRVRLRGACQDCERAFPLTADNH
jgi:hypothetical protein